jgi:hypothetical protein
MMKSKSAGNEMVQFISHQDRKDGKEGQMVEASNVFEPGLVFLNLFKEAVSGKVSIEDATVQFKGGFDLKQSVERCMNTGIFDHPLRDITTKHLHEVRDMLAVNGRINKKQFKNFLRLFANLFNDGVYESFQDFKVCCRYFFADMKRQNLNEMLDNFARSIEPRLIREKLTVKQFMEAIEKEGELKRFFELTEDDESYKFDKNRYRKLDICSEAKLADERLKEIGDDFRDFDFQMLGKLTDESYYAKCLMIMTNGVCHTKNHEAIAVVIKEIVDLPKYSIGISYNRRKFASFEKVLSDEIRRLFGVHSLVGMKKVSTEVHNLLDFVEELENLNVIKLKDIAFEMEEFECLERVISIRNAVK